MNNLKEDFLVDVESVQKIPIISSLLEVVCRTTGMGFAAVARVTDNSWVACSVRDEIAFGLKPGGELKLETTICNEIRTTHQSVIIEHVALDKVFAKHHTPEMYGFQSYISVPIFRKDGSFFGTLCAIDPKPAKINTPETIGMFNMFVDLISFHLHAIDDLQNIAARLLQEQKIAEVREQFISILGHDLRNPLGAVTMASELLLEKNLDEEGENFVKIIKRSSARMSGLIENILDFARGRLGNGIEIDNKENDNLGAILYQVIAELQTTNKSTLFEIDFDLKKSVTCDVNRIAQLLSNLISNAILYGKKEAPIIINAQSNDTEFTLSVTNYGNKIPDALIEFLFLPFLRGEEKKNRQGLGLGLYISSEIAKAHNGTLTALSTDAFTTFTLKIPVRHL